LPDYVRLADEHPIKAGAVVVTPAYNWKTRLGEARLARDRQTMIAMRRH
jgi:hypothetical protein